MSRDYVLQPFRPPVELHINYERELNQQQHAAVTAPPGPALVIAGAGSGKTRTLTYRAAFLLEQGIPPERILLLTFTNKAAKEMMGRVSDLLGGELSALWGGTFHAIGNRVLRRHAARLGYQPGFSILDRDDAEALIQTCRKELDIDLTATRFPKAAVLADIFSLAVNKQQPLAALLEAQFKYFAPLSGEISALQQSYAARKFAANSMDFDDLLALWLKLLEEHPDVREEQQRRFQFILVDEYQDTNKLQGALIDLLAAAHHNVMAVGDDCQSIYSWRGAHFLNILKFPDRHPGAKIFRIETNYRSTPEILLLANAAIAANLRQFPKELAAARAGGVKPIIVTCGDSNQQAAFVAQRVLQLREEGIPLKKMAVLYRAHFHALELQFELTRRNIPFSITSGLRFFEQAHIKDVTAWLKFITNPRDEPAFKRIVLTLPGIGARGADKIWNAFRAAPRDGQPPLASALQKIAAAVPKKTAVPWAQFTATIAQLEEPDIRRSASRMIHLVLDAGYEDYLQAEYTNYQARLSDLEQMAATSLQFASVEDFLTQLALQSSLEAEDNLPARADEDPIRLSTIHQAKGLEFEVVFVIMLCEGAFPSARSIEALDGEEEERRLLYVAVTRARSHLYLTYPLLRLTSNRDDLSQKPSRFLAEIPRGLVEEWNLKTPLG
ncbi:MAG TPA: UvrD-helicase domain-containing protein [Candidatus Acidoferrum sp.]|nr:UvrD-helicase domain-containing protein [Candidatus Acidoferrum sp.]